MRGGTKIAPKKSHPDDVSTRATEIHRESSALLASRLRTSPSPTRNPCHRYTPRNLSAPRHAQTRVPSISPLTRGNQQKWRQNSFLRVFVWENRAESKDRGRPNLIILWALDACLVWLWTVVTEQILVLLFWRLTTPLCFGAAWAKMTPEIRPTSRRKKYQLPDGFYQPTFPRHFRGYSCMRLWTHSQISGEQREEVEVKQEYRHIKFPTFSNVIFSEVRLFIFYLKPVLDSPLPCKINLKNNIDWGKAPLSLGSHLKLVQIAVERFLRQSCTTKVIRYPQFHLFWQIGCSVLHLAKLRLSSIIGPYAMTYFSPKFHFCMIT